TLTAYAAVGILSAQSLSLLPLILPGVLVGVPIGAMLMWHVQQETFRRVCMSFDAWVVSFGMSVLLRELAVVESPAAFLVLGVVVVLDAVLLYRFFARDVARLERVLSP